MIPKMKKKEKNNDKTDDQRYDEQQAAKSLSLCNLPLENTTTRRSSSEPQEFFEFFHGGSDHAMSSAEDIIFGGRLVPFRERPPPPASFRRRSESLSCASQGSVVAADTVMRASRSLDYERLRRGKAVRPRWLGLLMVGAVKLPAEMELGDIKSRQARQRTQSADGGGGRGGASWRLLKALSCKDHASVAVTASFCVPHV